MAYWIQSMPTTLERPSIRHFHCETREDINNMPRVGIDGVEQENDKTAHKACGYGSDVLCLADLSFWELNKTTNAWKELQ